MEELKDQSLMDKISMAITVIVMVIVAGYSIWILGLQAYEWMAYGKVNDYDIFWIIAKNSDCLNNHNIQPGYEILCRNERIQFTDWVGVNKIFRYLMDVNLAILGGVIVCVLGLYLNLFLPENEIEE